MNQTVDSVGGTFEMFWFENPGCRTYHAFVEGADRSICGLSRERGQGPFQKWQDAPDHCCGRCMNMVDPTWEQRKARRLEKK
jgi:hypothetical protein